MRILFLTHSFNSLTQRLYVELTRRGHEVSVEFDIHDSVALEAAELFQPRLIVAPYLCRRIPEGIWKNFVCLVLHPGIPGDRGPSALDWAIMNEETEWGVTALQANAEMDAGDIWATASFPMRTARKSSLYRHETTEVAVAVLLKTVERFEKGGFQPEPLDYGKPEVRGRFRPFMGQDLRSIRWEEDPATVILKKIRSADGFPGVLDTLFGEEYFLFDAHAEDTLKGRPGEVIARRHGAICRATVDGAVWISHLKKKTRDEDSFKLPAAMVLGEHLRHVPESPLPIHIRPEGRTFQEIYYQEKSGVGYLHFDFYNGAMSTEQCQRLLEAYQHALGRDTRVIALMGGSDFWSNGIHLNVIEAAESPAEESLRNIDAMNDLARAIICTSSHITLAAMRGNAGGGGVFLALAADRIYARKGIILNPHYKSMGNLYGSEYWTYLLPRRVGKERAKTLTENRLPVGAPEAKAMGLIDDCFGEDAVDFQEGIESLAQDLAVRPDFEKLLLEKNENREKGERTKSLATYRAEEMERMKLNFFGFDPSYHVARRHFVYKTPHSRTPPHLARHRRLKRTSNPKE